MYTPKLLFVSHGDYSKVHEKGVFYDFKKVETFEEMCNYLNESRDLPDIITIDKTTIKESEKKKCVKYIKSYCKNLKLKEPEIII